jgi:hypothetical protein
MLANENRLLICETDITLPALTQRVIELQQSNWPFRVLQPVLRMLDSYEIQPNNTR